jgi:ribulose-5-phosphate 4-epimerase/fuculose-1-phosphate aldolase
MQMKPKALIFLDFDGVLHDRFCPPHFMPECLALIDSVLREFPDVSVVISSHWRHSNGLDKLRELLGPIGERVIGQTPNLNYWRRFHEIEKYLTDTEQEGVPWVAIDDKSDLYPVDTPLILTNGYGVTPKNAVELRVALEEIIRTGSNANVNRCVNKLYEHTGPNLTIEALFELQGEDFESEGKK